MKDRMTLGHIADAAETAALTVADLRATERIVEACDWKSIHMKEKTVLIAQCVDLISQIEPSHVQF